MNIDFRWPRWLTQLEILLSPKKRKQFEILEKRAELTGKARETVTVIYGPWRFGPLVIGPYERETERGVIIHCDGKET